MWHRSIKMRSVGWWPGIPTGPCPRPGAVYKQLEMYTTTPNPHGALVPSPESEALGARQRPLSLGKEEEGTPEGSKRRRSSWGI